MPQRKKKARAPKGNVALAKKVGSIRRKRRAVFKTAPKALRKDVLRLLPTSRRQIGRKIKSKLAEIKLLKQQSGAESKAQLVQAIRDLAALSQIASKKKKRAERGASPRVVLLSPEAAEARDNAVEAALAQVNTQWKELLSQGEKGNAAIRAKRAMNMRLLAHRKVWLQRRHVLLANRLDFVHPVKLTAQQVRVRRKPLTLPTAWVVPDTAEVVVLIRLFGSRVKRLPGEDDVRYGARLKSFTQRALVRLVNARARGMAGPKGVEEAFVTTLAEDADALAAEAAAGGVADDVVAETMNDVISPAEDYIDEAVEEQVEVPGSIPSSEDLGKLIASADALADDSLAAPPEEADALEADLMDPEAQDSGWELFIEGGKPTTTAIAAGLAGLGLIWFLSGR